MATLACRVQFLDDTDPFNSTNFPEPSRPPLFTFREDLALGTQLAGVHRLLRAPHKVLPGGVGWAPWTQPGAAVRAAVWAPRPGASRAPWAGLGRPQGTSSRANPPPRWTEGLGAPAGWRRTLRGGREGTARAGGGRGRAGAVPARGGMEKASRSRAVSSAGWAGWG